MNDLKAIIAEDEEVTRTGLRIMLHRLWPELQICGEAENGKEALQIIEQKKPDIVFLDIKMPRISGLQVAKQVFNKTRVIFVTAYDQFAVEAFESEAVDYLLKPVSEERLIKTITRLKKELSHFETSSQFCDKMNKIIKMMEQKVPDEKLRLIKVKNGTEIMLIPISQVYFFKAEYKYTTVQTEQNEFIIKTPIKTLEKMVDPNQFWRIHRSTIVNIDKIDKIKRSITNMMVLTFAEIDKTVKVSRAFEHLFRHM